MIWVFWHLHLVSTRHLGRFWKCPQVCYYGIWTAVIFSPRFLAWGTCKICTGTQICQCYFLFNALKYFLFTLFKQGPGGSSMWTCYSCHWISDLLSSRAGFYTLHGLIPISLVGVRLSWMLIFQLLSCCVMSSTSSSTVFLGSMLHLLWHHYSQSWGYSLFILEGSFWLYTILHILCHSLCTCCTLWFCQSPSCRPPRMVHEPWLDSLQHFTQPCLAACCPFAARACWWPGKTCPQMCCWVAWQGDTKVSVCLHLLLGCLEPVKDKLPHRIIMFFRHYLEVPIPKHCHAMTRHVLADPPLALEQLC
jgi:hypothetical protein